MTTPTLHAAAAARPLALALLTDQPDLLTDPSPYSFDPDLQISVTGDGTPAMRYRQDKTAQTHTTGLDEMDAIDVW